MEDISTLLIFILIGFIAQVIDGGLGMGFGISSNTLLMSFGVPPAVSSAAVHTAEIFTTGVSGFFHWRSGNVEKKLFLNLVIFGIIGGVSGAYFLSLVDGHKIKPFIAAYLLLLGTTIVRKAFKKIHEEDAKIQFFPVRLIARTITQMLNKLHPYGQNIPHFFSRILGVLGGFLDSIGGGGWGPVVTSTLVVRNHSPRHSIGTANAAEFFVTTATSLTFLVSIGFFSSWQVIVGLLIGGSLAAPFASILCKKIPPRFLMLMVGMLIIGLSLWTIGLSVKSFLPTPFCICIK